MNFLVDLRFLDLFMIVLAFQTQPPPQSLMSIPMQPPQPVPPPAQAVSNNASPVRQGVG